MKQDETISLYIIYYLVKSLIIDEENLKEVMSVKDSVYVTLISNSLDLDKL